MQMAIWQGRICTLYNCPSRARARVQATVKSSTKLCLPWVRGKRWNKKTKSCRSRVAERYRLREQIMRLSRSESSSTCLEGLIVKCRSWKRKAECGSSIQQVCIGASWIRSQEHRTHRHDTSTVLQPANIHSLLAIPTHQHPHTKNQLQILSRKSPPSSARLPPKLSPTAHSSSAPASPTSTPPLPSQTSGPLTSPPEHGHPSPPSPPLPTSPPHHPSP